MELCSPKGWNSTNPKAHQCCSDTCKIDESHLVESKSSPPFLGPLYPSNSPPLQDITKFVLSLRARSSSKTSQQQRSLSSLPLYTLETYVSLPPSSPNVNPNSPFLSTNSDTNGNHAVLAREVSNFLGSPIHLSSYSVSCHKLRFPVVKKRF